MFCRLTLPDCLPNRHKWPRVPSKLVCRNVGKIARSFKNATVDMKYEALRLVRISAGWNRDGISLKWRYDSSLGRDGGGQFKMAEPLSLDIRKRIVCRVSRRTTAGRVAASESARIKLVERYERTGSLEPGQMGSHRPFALASHDALVRGLIAAHPDQTLDELLVRLIEREVVVRRTSVWPDPIGWSGFNLSS